MAGLNLFDPSSTAERRKKAALIRATEQQVSEWAMEAVPEDLRAGCRVSVFDACACTDENCDPTGTVVQYFFREGRPGAVEIPKGIFDVSMEDFREVMPPEDVLRAWSEGRKMDWPPMPEAPPAPTFETHPLRFDIGRRVRCRIGPDPVRGWRAGRVVKHYYRESKWAPDKFVPYQVQLDDGTLIYAPRDKDKLIQAIDE